MLPREIEIVKILLSDSRTFTIAELAGRLNVSSRTAKNDIKQINLSLQPYKAKINTRPGVGIWLEVAPHDKNALLAATTKLVAETDGTSQRRYKIACRLLASRGFVSTESIGEILYISPSTVLKDLDELSAFFATYHLQLYKKAKYGIRILGVERQRRLAHAAALRKILPKKEILFYQTLFEHFPGVDFEVLAEAVRETERQYGIRLADDSYRNLLINLAIVFSSPTNPDTLDPPSWDPNLFVAEPHDSSQAHSIARYLATVLQDRLSTRLSSSDVSYLSMHLLSAKLTQMQPNDGYFQNRQLLHESQLYKLMLQALARAESVYQYSFSSDIHLVNTLFSHLVPALNRARNHIAFDNPHRDIVKKEEAFAFEIATLFAHELLAQEPVDLSDDEIAFFALHFGAFLQREQSLHRRNTRVAIVCATGAATSEFVRARLENLFPNLVVHQIFPSSRAVDSLDPDQFDFVISTVPLQLAGVPVVQISPMVRAEDIERINAYLANSPLPAPVRSAQSDFSLLEYLHPNITFLQQPYTGRDETLAALADKMVAAGYVTPEFPAGIQEREAISDTSIGFLTAIPHTFQDYVCKEAIGLMTLRKPIAWGRYRVQVVLMLSLLADTQHRSKSVFVDLHALLQDQTIIDRLCRATSFSEIQDFLSRPSHHLDE